VFGGSGSLFVAVAGAIGRSLERIDADPAQRRDEGLKTRAAVAVDQFALR
jgi:hypothetical protein